MSSCTQVSIGSSPASTALTCLLVRYYFLAGHILAKWLILPYLKQLFPFAGQKLPVGWASFPHPLCTGLVVGLPVALSGILLLVLYHLGRVILFTSLLSLVCTCWYPLVLHSPLTTMSLPCLAISSAFTVLQTNFRSPFFRIDSFQSSLLLVFTTVNMMIALSSVIGNSQWSPARLIFFATTYGEHTESALPLLNLLDVLTVHNVYRFEILKFTYLWHKGLLPKLF